MTRDENAKYAKMMIWHTTDGREINIEDMTLNHLYNALNYAYADPRLYDYVEPLQKEIDRKEDKKSKRRLDFDEPKEKKEEKTERGFVNSHSKDGSVSVVLADEKLAKRVRQFCRASNITIRKFAETAFTEYLDKFADEQFTEAASQIETLTAGLTEEQKKFIASMMIGG